MEEITKDIPIGGESHAQFAAEPTAKTEDSIAHDPMAPVAGSDMYSQIVDAIKTVYDPEIPVNIYELGLIYEINIGEEGKIDVLMTLTSPGCPAAGMLPGDVEEKVRTVGGVNDVKVEVTFEPPWDQSMMTEEARLELGFM